MVGSKIPINEVLRQFWWWPNGTKYIYINAFDKKILKDNMTVQHDLTSSPVAICGGGSGFWRVRYNVKLTYFMEVHFNAPK